jgi:LPXTG-motif cell wall-anchored protein
VKKWVVVSALALGIASSAGLKVDADTDKDCGDFNGDHQAVMEFWYSNGYSASNDPHDLDRDSDGLPCEVDKDEYDSFVASKNNDNEEDSSTTPSTDDNNSSNDSGQSSEGGELPATASSSPLAALGGALMAAVGGVLVFGRKLIK